MNNNLAVCCVGRGKGVCRREVGVELVVFLKCEFELVGCVYRGEDAGDGPRPKKNATLAVPVLRLLSELLDVEILNGATGPPSFVPPGEKSPTRSLSSQ